MLQTLIIDRDPEAGLRQKLNAFSSRVNLSGTFPDLIKAYTCLNSAQLVFYNVNYPGWEVISTTLSEKERSFHLVAYGLQKKDAFKAYKIKANDFLLKPLKNEALHVAISKVEKEISSKKELKTLSMNGTDIVTIPTTEGYEFIPASKIIRCEGLQKCTRIITENRTDIVSSYNLGAFAKMLSPFGFFLCHRSYLINVSKVVKLHREGTITMSDNETVPLARRQRVDFLKIFPKI